MKQNIEKKLFYEKNNKSSFFTSIFKKKISQLRIKKQF